jgi:hypothetical protein
VSKVIFVPKATGTHGDVFAAVGLADLLSSAANVDQVQITESPTGFEIHTETESADFASIGQAPGYPFLKTSEKIAVPRGVNDYVDYKVEKAKADRRKKLLQGKSRKSAGPEIEELLKREEARPDWRLLQVLNTLQGDETSNRIHALIARMKPEEFSRAVEAGLASLAAARASELDWPANSVQLFTPSAAKGYSRLKPDSTDRNDKTKEQWTDPFVEWLRYRGYFAVACPFFHGQKAENIRLLCPIPADISAKALRQITGELRTAGIFGGPPKLDSLAALELAELLIRHSEEYSDISASRPLLGIRLRSKRPADVISGIFITNYQSLGNAKAVSAMSVIALPGWFTLIGDGDARTFLAILDEHKRVVRSLADDHSDEIGLLIDYRRFLEARGDHAIAILLDFMARFGSLVLRARDQGRRIAQFTTINLERLVMANAYKLSEVLANPGFKAVAAAVRSSTVNAQAQKAMNRPEYREIRYDLIPELKRKSSLSGNEPLVHAISEFVSSYNVENARRRELGKPAPRNVTTEEFESPIQIIEVNRASIIGPMLCAYGSCRLPREQELDAEESDSEPVIEQNQGRDE